MPVNSFDQIIGGRLKRFRNLNDYTQENLAALLDLSINQIKNYEEGKDRIPANLLFEFSNILNTPINEFYYQSGNHKELVSNPNTNEDDKLIYEKSLQLIKFFMSIEDVKSQDLLLHLAKKLSNKAK